MKKIIVFSMMTIFVVTGLVFGNKSKLGQGSVNAETRYFNSTINATSSIGSLAETIYYARRERNSFVMNPALPAYVGRYTCGPLGGLITIAYMNKTLPGLIPGHTAGTQIGSAWLWASVNSIGLKNTEDNLATLMGGGFNGVTVWQYMIGIGMYIQGKGYNATFVGIASTPNSLSAQCYEALHNGYPVTLFLSGFNLTQGAMSMGNGSDYVYLTEYDGGHVMIAYGYDIISYYDSNDYMFRQDTYLYVNDGFGLLNRIRINTNCSLNDAYGVEIK